jgi:hypothetical protein
MLNEKSAHFLIRKQGIFCWNDLLSSFEEGDVKGFAEIRTWDLRSKSSALTLDQGSFSWS